MPNEAGIRKIKLLEIINFIIMPDIWLSNSAESMKGGAGNSDSAGGEAGGDIAVDEREGCLRYELTCVLCDEIVGISWD